MSGTARRTDERIDLWDPELLRDYTTPSVDPFTHAAEIVATEVEFDTRWEMLRTAFPKAVGKVDAVPDEFWGMGALDRDAAKWRFDHLGSTSVTPEGEVISVDTNVVEEFFARADLIGRVARWHALTGEPYDLPVFVTAETAVIDEHNAPRIVEILTNERVVHDLGGHDVRPSIACDECTPLPGLAAVTLGAMPTELGNLLETTAHRAATLRRSAEEQLGRADLYELIEDGHETVPMIDGVAPDRQGVGLVVGPSSALKTFWSLDRMAIEVACDSRGSRAVFVVGEGLDGFGPRIEAEAMRRGVSVSDLVGRLSVVIEVPDLFGRDPAYHRLLAQLERERPRVTVIDTLALASGDAIHDNAGHMSRVMASAEHLAQASGGVVVLIAHSGKRAERGVRGSSAIQAAADWALYLSVNGDVLTVKTEKMRDGEAGLAYKYRAEHHGRSLALEPIASAHTDPTEGSPSDEPDVTPALDVPTRILDVLASADLALSTSQVVAAVNDDAQGEVALSTVRGHLSELVKTGDVLATGENRNLVYTWAG